MKKEGLDESLVLDLEPFGLPYQIWLDKPKQVVNPKVKDFTLWQQADSPPAAIVGLEQLTVGTDFNQSMDEVGDILRREASNAGNIDSHDSLKLKETLVQKFEASAKIDTNASKQEEKLRKALTHENLILVNENTCLAIHEIYRDSEHLKAFLQYCSDCEHMSSTGTPPMGMHPMAMSPSCAPGSLTMQKESPSSLTGDMGMYDFGPTSFQQYTDPTHSSISISASSHNASSKVGEVAVPPEQRTTLMMRNIPNSYTSQMLFDLLDERGFNRKYDFVYMPLDFKKQVGLGDAFINLVDCEAADLFFKVFTGFSAWVAQSDKKCEVTWSNSLQGRDANINRYRNSPIMHDSLPDLYKPVLFDQNGMPEAFPRPTKRLRLPREWR